MFDPESFLRLALCATVEPAMLQRIGSGVGHAVVEHAADVRRRAGLPPISYGADTARWQRSMVYENRPSLFAFMDTLSITDPDDGVLDAIHRNPDMLVADRYDLRLDASKLGIEHLKKVPADKVDRLTVDFKGERADLERYLNVFPNVRAVTIGSTYYIEQDRRTSPNDPALTWDLRADTKLRAVHINAAPLYVAQWVRAVHLMPHHPAVEMIHTLDFDHSPVTLEQLSACLKNMRGLRSLRFMSVVGKRAEDKEGWAASSLDLSSLQSLHVSNAKALDITLSDPGTSLTKMRHLTCERTDLSRDVIRRLVTGELAPKLRSLHCWTHDDGVLEMLHALEAAGKLLEGLKSIHVHNYGLYYRKHR